MKCLAFLNRNRATTGLTVFLKSHTEGLPQGLSDFASHFFFHTDFASQKNLLRFLFLK